MERRRSPLTDNQHQRCFSTPSHEPPREHGKRRSDPGGRGAADDHVSSAPGQQHPGHTIVLIGSRKDVTHGVGFLHQNWWHSKFFVEVSAKYLASAGANVTFAKIERATRNNVVHSHTLQQKKMITPLMVSDPPATLHLRPLTSTVKNIQRQTRGCSYTTVGASHLYKRKATSASLPIRALYLFSTSKMLLCYMSRDI